MDPRLPIVTISREWMGFFMLLLLKQSSSEWAPDFLQSLAWAIINQSSTDNHLPARNNFTFSLPKLTPLVNFVDLSCRNHSIHSSKSRSLIIITELYSDEDAELNPPSFNMEGLVDPMGQSEMQPSKPKLEIVTVIPSPPAPADPPLVETGPTPLAPADPTSVVTGLTPLPSTLIDTVLVATHLTPPIAPMDPALGQPVFPTPTKRGSKRGKPIIISKSEVRRSDRIHVLNKGFKPSSCKGRNCLGCETKPPLILPL